MAIPTNIRIPFVSVEIDNSRATQGPALLSYRSLLIGQKTSAGSQGANTIARVTSAAQVATLAGRGSMLHRMAQKYFANNSFTETYIGVLSDDGAGVAASGTITVTGPATASGTISLYIGGNLVTVGVTSGDAQNAIASAINSAINANGDLAVTSTVSTNVVTVTHRHKGLVGNSFDMRVNYQQGEALPTGVALAFVALSGGTTAPSLATLIAALGDMWFQIFVMPYTDATSLTAMETELASRFAPLRMIDGIVVTSAVGSQSTLASLGNGRNSPHVCIAAQPGESPVTPPDEFAAAVGALVAFYGNEDPARPFQTLAVAGVLPPAELDFFTAIPERNLLLFDGIATTKSESLGTVQLDRMITTYQVNGTGAPDTSYLDVNTMLTLLYLRFSFRNQIRTRYPRHKLANDGTMFGPGQPVITPMIGKAEALSWFRSMERLGLVENFELFKESLVCQRNASDPNRLDWLLPPDLINQFIVGGVTLQFAL